MLNFSDIYLSKRERQLLKRLGKGKQTLTIDEIEVFEYLSKLEFASSDFTVQYRGSRDSAAEQFCITGLGRRYLLWLRAQNRRLAWDWVRYGVTTVIAVIALLTAIFLR